EASLLDLDEAVRPLGACAAGIGTLQAEDKRVYAANCVTARVIPDNVRLWEKLGVIKLRGTAHCPQTTWENCRSGRQGECVRDKSAARNPHVVSQNSGFQFR